MSPTSFLRLASLLLAAGVMGVPIVAAQTRGIDVMYGRWWHSGPTDVYSGAVYRRFLGVFDYGLGFFHYDDSRSLDDRTQTGGQVSLALGRDGAGFYVLGEAGVGLRHRDRNLDAQWGVGGGYAIRPLPFLSLGMEAQYRVEDRNVRGFWQLHPLDRRGLLLKGGIVLGFATAASGRRPGGVRRGGFRAPSASEITDAASSAGASREAAELTAKVVRTALDAMGTPYRWGGTDANGYDCSGLIQYAYGEHGILLPRVSRDQARMGTLVERDVQKLLPGDILGFAASGKGLSHVGLYVGDGLFIHSASAGVKLSSLTATDPDSRWWRQRWTVVRRIIN